MDNGLKFADVFMCKADDKVLARAIYSGWSMIAFVTKVGF